MDVLWYDNLVIDLVAKVCSNSRKVGGLFDSADCMLCFYREGEQNMTASEHGMKG